MKVKYGLKNVHYAVATIADDGSATYAKPKPFTGAISISMEAQGENAVLRADNMNYFVSNGNSGYQGDLEMALYTDEFRKDILGEEIAENGIQYEVQNAPIVHFALLFQFQDDVKNTRHAFYNCTATRPSVASETTPENGVEPQTESSTITATNIYVPELDKEIVKGKAGPNDEAYAAWFEDVQKPSAAAGGEG